MVLVGRDRELADVGAALGALAAGRGGMVLVTGEPGIGKTALCEEVVARAAAGGLATAWAGCWRSPPLPPLWPWRQVLRELSAAEARPVEVPKDLAPWLAHLAGGEAPVADPDAALVWLTDALVSVFAVVRRPTVVVLDDLQWADARSLQVVAALSVRLRRVPTAVVATCRSEDMDPDPLALLSTRARVVALGAAWTGRRWQS